MREIKIERIWAMPNTWTFKIIPIKALLEQEKAMGLFKKGYWCDPFAGKLSPADIRNDLNPENPAEFHLDALEFLKQQGDASFDGVLYDPPYSFTQAGRIYKSFGKDKMKLTPTNRGYWAKIRNELARITKQGGKVISFGWTSTGLGTKRGFKMKKILMVFHGGAINDTLCTVEIKDLLEQKPKG